MSGLIPVEWLQHIENTGLAAAIRQSNWLYPGLEIVHIVGIVLLVGGAFLFDLRLLNFSPRIPVAALATHVLPWSRRGLLLVVPSGLLLFSTNAESLGNDPMFWLKMILIVVAGVNVAVFHRITFRSSTGWQGGKTPPGAKAAAICSMVVWLATIACGRLLAY
ncbi:hypothetical protein LX87_02852 [Larkinella arboricola]|uniref:DUF6644 domain-containing protein n=1 Tax=Larkinella arboricola TaxID=643671 RepID=A0A327X009_LARAB|nr:DUF6644 family protein [Larkinella arboricola]RAJ97945.1 hypothetical protein LX87_02852 [Larkinella arboricola]